MFSRKTLCALSAGIGLFAAAWYLRPMRHTRLVGVDWQSGVGSARCEMQWREVFCTTQRWELPASYTTVQYNPVTRGIHRVSHVWSAPDSDRWRELIDSAEHAVIARHAEPLPCDTSETRFQLAEAWRLGNEEERLYATPVRGNARHGPYWFLDVQLVPLGAAGCGRELHYRLLSPAEMGQRVRVWIGERLGF
jgi:hypothetical protein